ncbi:hypothetical protein ACFX1X_005205 [Malus domestica]
MSQDAVVNLRYDQVYVTNLPLCLCASNLPPLRYNLKQCLRISFEPHVAPTIFQHQLKASSECSQFRNDAVGLSYGFSITK